MHSGLGHGDAVQGSVELTIPGARQSMSLLLDDHTGIGAVPFSRAKASLERNRRTWAVSPRILAAVSSLTTDPMSTTWGQGSLVSW